MDGVSFNQTQSKPIPELSKVEKPAVEIDSQKGLDKTKESNRNEVDKGIDKPDASQVANVRDEKKAALAAKKEAAREKERLAALAAKGELPPTTTTESK